MNRGHLHSDILSDKDVYVDPSLEMTRSLSETKSDPDSNELDLALLSTSTNLKQEVLYNFIKNQTAVSIIGESADLQAIDYLTEGKNNLGGMILHGDQEVQTTLPSLSRLSKAPEIQQSFAYETIAGESAELVTLHPTRTRIDIDVYRGNSTEPDIATQTRSSTDRVLNKVEQSIQRKETGGKPQYDNISISSVPNCGTGDMTCAGEFRDDGDHNGGSWSKVIKIGYVTEYGTTYWGMYTRIRMTPNRSPMFRKWQNEFVERE